MQENNNRKEVSLWVYLGWGIGAGIFMAWLGTQAFLVVLFLFLLWAVIQLEKDILAVHDFQRKFSMANNYILRLRLEAICKKLKVSKKDIDDVVEELRNATGEENWKKFEKDILEVL